MIATDYLPDLIDRIPIISFCDGAELDRWDLEGRITIICFNTAHASL
jgi:hypothetical protein